ncbi:MAG TPA: hypothetical protein VJA94_20910 [Candidatus Angelobacter sp.]
MTVGHPRHNRVLIFCFVLAAQVVFAQGTPLTLGPLTVTVPPGWIAQTNTVPVRLISPDSTPQQSFQVEFYPFEQTGQDVREAHTAFWARLAGVVQFVSQPQSGATGQFIWTLAQAQRAPGLRDTLVLYSAKSGSIYIPITVDASTNQLFMKNMPAVETMLRSATLSGAAPAASQSPATGAVPAAPASAGNMATLADYVYTTPPGWTATQYTDAMVLMSPVSVTNERCVVSIWPMRTAGSNLLQDANGIFQDVYKTYELRNMTNRGTPMPSSIVRGTSGQGWDYVIVRRGIAPPGSPESRLGFVFVAKLNNRLAVISGVSKDPLVSTCLGELAGNVWPRFFYSLSFKNWTAVDQAAAMRKRMAGVWMGGGATAASQITFAANGRYLDAAARSEYHALNNSEVLQTTTGFAGNGAYTLRGNNITMKSDRGRTETGLIRVEDESTDEGRTWKPILYLLRVSTVDGKDYEMRYLKQ